MSPWKRAFLCIVEIKQYHRYALAGPSTDANVDGFEISVYPAMPVEEVCGAEDVCQNGCDDGYPGW